LLQCESLVKGITYTWSRLFWLKINVYNCLRKIKVKMNERLKVETKPNQTNKGVNVKLKTVEVRESADCRQLKGRASKLQRFEQKTNKRVKTNATYSRKM